MKICTKCNVEKPFEEFHFRKDQNRHRTDCKECNRKRDKEYNIKIGKNSFKNLKFKTLLDNGLKNCPKCNNIKKIEEFRNRKDCKSGKVSHCINCLNIKRMQRIKIDPIYKFSLNVRSNILMSFKRGKNKFKKNAKTEIILGCTIEEFRNYIESKFSKGMSLENHGKWHLDHIIPLASANTEEDIIKLNHYTNFQPLWAFDNLSKGCKY